MTKYVELQSKRNRGWPWPEESYGLTPVFGEDGWCRSCGVPQREQCGSLVLQGGRSRFTGAWEPYWQYVICLDGSIAEEVGRRFAVDLRAVEWRGGKGELGAMQVMAPSGANPWFDHQELRAAAVERHGEAGKACPECGVWRWMPLGFDGYGLPPLRYDPATEGLDVVASPEWFGDGHSAFRQILMRKELAELIVAASPRDFAIGEPH